MKHREFSWLGLWLFSLLLALCLPLFFNNLQPVTAQSQIVPELLAQTSRPIAQGHEVLLDGKPYAVAWIQWQEQGQLKTGLSDTGALQLLGLEFLATNQPNVQPVQWFSSTPRPLATRFMAPYRYLDVTELLSGANSTVQGQRLMLNATGAEILSLREGNQAWGKRIVLDLSRPAFWQVSQAKNDGVVTLNATATAGVSSQKGKQSKVSPIDEDDLGRDQTKRGTFETGIWLENLGNTSKVHLQLPSGDKLQVTTLTNPDRLVIDVRADGAVPKTIAWTEGLTWHQRRVRLNGSEIFPVTWLELDLKAPKLSMKPITANAQGLTGLSPLVTIARDRQASAGINGGFFNRNTQLPLGAIKDNNRWLSGPILNRGAIAWNNQGQVYFGRWELQETLRTSTGKTLVVGHLNSGYGQKGLARYTPDWGATYSPLSDNEAIAIVENNRIVRQQPGGKAGKTAIPIPANGYLLVLRNASADALSSGTTLTLQRSSNPVNFDDYPYGLAGGPLLLNNGKIVLNAEAEKFNPAFQKQGASRTAIAVDGAGKIWLVAVHNRVGGRGPTLAEMAQLLKTMGAVSGLNLDGGSSTSLVLGGQLIDRSAVTAARVNNGLGVFIKD